MHVFLTGEVQVGKSTALRKFLAETRVPVDGFVTEFDSRGNKRKLYLIHFDSEFGKIEQRKVAEMLPNGFKVYPDVFDDFGAHCIDSAGKQRMILMDELGRMEEFAPRFTAAVMRRLDGNKPIIGVVKMRESPFLDAVRAHPNVEVMMVTKENRNEIPEQLAHKLGVWG